VLAADGLRSTAIPYVADQEAGFVAGMGGLPGAGGGLSGVVLGVGVVSVPAGGLGAGSEPGPVNGPVLSPGGAGCESIAGPVAGGVVEPAGVSPAPV
jgi:hypothetical protein